MCLKPTSCMLLLLAMALHASAMTAKADSAVKPLRKENGLAWYEAKELGLEGQAWNDVTSPYDRFPARAQKTVRPPVWSLSRNSAGLCVRFTTDASEIHAHWTLTSERLALPHMPATGVSGLDLYARTNSGKWAWVANGRPAAKDNTSRLVGGLPKGDREYLLYLPLYNGVTSVEIGVSEKATIKRAPPRAAAATKPVVFYGTSITQGGCASRPGMVHTAIVGRWLDRPVINLGFSGNGRMEAEVAELMAEIDAAAYVIDCLPNINAETVIERTKPLVAILRRERPDTPVILVEDRNYTDGWLLTSKRQRNASSQAALRAVFERLKDAGDENLYYLPGSQLLGDDHEGTVDSSHPTDLGFMRQAEAFYELLKPIVGK